uniref:O-antigen polymerase n=1 Tax=Steinernema glaseri TaxID=37863 RepID=A0A1I7YIN7_9BILA
MFTAVHNLGFWYWTTLFTTYGFLIPVFLITITIVYYALDINKIEITIFAVLSPILYICNGRLCGQRTDFFNHNLMII